MANRLKRDKWVRVMADYCADGVWAKDGCGMSADELPVSQGLLNRLRAWQRLFDGDEPADEPAFSIEGEAISKAVKAELPDWTVVYFNADKADAARDWYGGDRSAFEYEITSR